MLASLYAGGNTEGLPMTDDDKARETAKGLIQGYIGPDHKVIDMIERRYYIAFGKYPYISLGL